MSERLFCLLLLSACVGLEVSGHAQGVIPRAQPVSPSPPSSNVQGLPPSGAGADRSGVLIDPNRRLQPGDQLSFEIEEDREPAPFPKAITATGDIDIFPLGKVNVAGMTTSQAAAEIRRRLEADYYYKATVRLSIDRVNASASMGTIYLSGEVGAVGAQGFYADKPPTLSQAILNAGGFRTFGDSRRVKVTRSLRGGDVKTYEVDVKEVIEKGRVDKDFNLLDGDRVHVPRVWGKI